MDNKMFLCLLTKILEWFNVVSNKNIQCVVNIDGKVYVYENNEMIEVEEE